MSCSTIAATVSPSDVVRFVRHRCLLIELIDTCMRRLAVKDVQVAADQPSLLPLPSPMVLFNHPSVPSLSPPPASDQQARISGVSAPYAYAPMQSCNQRMPQRQIVLKMWQLATLAANRVAATVEIRAGVRCASSSSRRAFAIWRYAATGHQRIRLLFLDSSTRHRQWQYRRAGFQGFLLCTWQGARAAQGQSHRQSHAEAKDAKLMNEKLHEQLDLALDNLTEANEALHKARQHEQALKNQVLELALDNAMAHEHAERAQAQADEAALKATQDASDAQDQIHELTLHKSQLELKVAQTNDSLLMARRDFSNLQDQIQELTRQNSALELDAYASKQAASDMEVTSLTLEKKREAISKEYRELAAQMEDLKDEFSRCSIQRFAHIVIANLNATIQRLHQMDDLSRCEVEREQGLSTFMIPSRKKDGDRLGLTELDSTKSAVWSLQCPDQYLNVSDLHSFGDGRREAPLGRDSAKFLALERQLERRNLQIQELESKLKWQQTAGDEAAMELCRALKVVRRQEAELAHIMMIVPEEMKCMARSSNVVNATNLSEDIRRPSSSSSTSADEDEMRQEGMDFAAGDVHESKEKGSKFHLQISNIHKMLKHFQDLAKEENQKIAISSTAPVFFPESLADAPKTSAEERAQLLQDELRSLTYRNECLVGQIHEVECALRRENEEVERLQNDLDSVQRALDESENKCTASEEALKGASERLCRAEVQAKEAYAEGKSLRLEVARLSAIEPALDNTEKKYTASETALEVLTLQLRDEVASAKSLQTRAEAQAKEAHAEGERLRSEVARLRVEGCSDKDLIAQLSSCEEEILSLIETLQEERAVGEVARKNLESELERERLLHSEKLSETNRDAAWKMDNLAAEVLKLKTQKDEIFIKLTYAESLQATSEERAENNSLRRKAALLREVECNVKTISATVAACMDEIAKLQSSAHDERTSVAQEAAQRSIDHSRKKNAAIQPGDPARNRISKNRMQTQTAALSTC